VGKQAASERRVRPGARADNTISESLRRQYSADQEISQYGIGIGSQGGRVTLTGTVGSYDIRDRIVDMARNTHGVVAVDSRVVVNTNLKKH
jgi:osmotically-inducible protein OsmY